MLETGFPGDIYPHVYRRCFDLVRREHLSGRRRLRPDLLSGGGSEGQEPLLAGPHREVAKTLDGRALLERTGVDERPARD